MCRQSKISKILVKFLTFLTLFWVIFAKLTKNLTKNLTEITGNAKNVENITSIFDIYRLMSKIPVYFQPFWHMKFFIILLVSLRLLQKLKAEIRQLIFGRFSTIKNFWLSTFYFCKIAKNFGQHSTLYTTQISWRAICEVQNDIFLSIERVYSPKNRLKAQNFAQIKYFRGLYFTEYVDIYRK